MDRGKEGELRAGRREGGREGGLLLLLGFGGRGNCVSGGGREGGREGGKEEKDEVM